MNKAWGIVGILIGVIIVYMLGAFSGYTYCHRSSDKNQIKQLKSDAVEVGKHDKETKKIAVKADRAKVIIRNVPDPTSCLDTPVPDAFADGLRNAYSATRP